MKYKYSPGIKIGTNMNGPKIGIIIPTRGDRPNFLKFAIRQIERQTKSPHQIITVDNKPFNDQPDLCKRYKIGCRRALKSGCDLAIFWEDDDWYHKSYIEWITKKWVDNGKPDLLGINTTNYYHLKTNKRVRFKHEEHASAFNTVLNVNFIPKIRWPSNSTISLDKILWKQGKGILIPWDNTPLSIGIKHNIGKVGGGWHNPDRKGWQDAGKWFSKIVSKSDLAFYQKLISEEA